jgi:hypothetical protein
MGKSHDLATISDDGISTLKVDTIKSTGGTTAMSVDSSGRVFRSVIPAWRVSVTNNQAETAAGTFKVEFDKHGTENCFLQGGVTLSSGTITVPVAGLYRVGSTIRVDDVTGSYYIISYIRKNQEVTGASDSYVIADDHGTNYHSLVCLDLYQCQANDQLECYLYVQSDTSWNINHSTSHFNGHLVG